ncbi:MAG: exodeoxyribonuclease VII small subunit [Pseudomonadota bacterium]
MSPAKRKAASPDEASAPVDATPSLAEVQAELEAIIEQLEDEQTGLEKSIELYERGAELVSTAGRVLAEAEQRVRVLTDDPSEDDAADEADLDDT